MLSLERMLAKELRALSGLKMENYFIIMMQHCRLISADVTSRAVGPKYIFQRLGTTGQSYIDHCLIPIELMPCVLSCGVKVFTIEKCSRLNVNMITSLIRR